MCRGTRIIGQQEASTIGRPADFRKSPGIPYISYTTALFDAYTGRKVFDLIDGSVASTDSTAVVCLKDKGLHVWTISEHAAIALGLKPGASAGE